MDDSICTKCGGDNLTDYPVCLECAKTAHFPHRRLCLCETCASQFAIIGRQQAADHYSKGWDMAAEYKQDKEAA